MTLHQQASALAAPVLRRETQTKVDASFAAVVLWAALGLVLTFLMLKLEPGAVQALQTLS